MSAATKCLLYAFLCLAVFLEIESKGPVLNDGVIDIDDVKGDVIEGSGKYGGDDDVDQEESSGGLEDDEDTPLSSFTPGSGPGGGAAAAQDPWSREAGSGARQGNDVDEDDLDALVTESETPSERESDTSRSRPFSPSLAPSSSHPPPPPTLPPIAPYTTTTRSPSYDPNGPDGTDYDDPDEVEGSAAGSSGRWDDEDDRAVEAASSATSSGRGPHAGPGDNGPGSWAEEEFERDYPLNGDGASQTKTDDDDEDVVEIGSGDSRNSFQVSRTTVSVCHDRDYRCTRYESENRCRDWPRWMREYCPSTCGFCFPDQSPIPGLTDLDKTKKHKHGVSKVPHKSSSKPTKPDPTKFITRYDGDRNPPTKIPSTTDPVVTSPVTSWGDDFSMEDNENVKGETADSDFDRTESNFDDNTNKIHHDGKTAYDRENEYDRNEIPSIGKAVMGPKHQHHGGSLWTQPGILAAVIGAAVVGLLCAVLLVMFIVYRMRKKDEGSYDLDETTKRSPRINGYQRTNQHEFYA